ncbi:UNVERIFIED_CONTAM: hypothetical protein FKN15_073305 [Acipenser sinensis]
MGRWQAGNHYPWERKCAPRDPEPLPCSRALDLFIHSLSLKELRRRIRLAHPRSITQALEKAEEMEAVMMEEARAHHRSGTKAVRAGDLTGSDESDGEQEEELVCASQAAESPLPRKPPACRQSRHAFSSSRSHPSTGKQLKLAGPSGNASGLTLPVLINTVHHEPHPYWHTPQRQGGNPEARHATTAQIKTVTGHVTPIHGKQVLQVRCRDCQLEHEFWLADIGDRCILGLDLLTKTGAHLDLANLILRWRRCPGTLAGALGVIAAYWQQGRYSSVATVPLSPPQKLVVWQQYRGCERSLAGLAMAQRAQALIADGAMLGFGIPQVVNPTLGSN